MFQTCLGLVLVPLLMGEAGAIARPCCWLMIS